VYAELQMAEAMQIWNSCFNFIDHCDSKH